MLEQENTYIDEFRFDANDAAETKPPKLTGREYLMTFGASVALTALIVLGSLIV